MKTLLKTKIAMLVLLTGLAFSCKKNENKTESPGYTDSTETIIDTVGPEVDTVTNDTVRTITTDSVKK
ncbi:hypothetical protein [Flavobacterium sp. Root186]|uniref:hypothetical protein n=1 Tax=Flavobacterium sp. Root186 TaxID=1736485 RepID=UPI0006F7D48A|nr:hypothetical protein [Flavobacterium sp. Root186]KRB59678.1 hypothetical protein ASD98_00730 [Flavobacterium sp. Root186]